MPAKGSRLRYAAIFLFCIGCVVLVAVSVSELISFAA